ncbi:small secreted protein [Streptomyces sp. RY43-2]|uniref:Small secreted protein n=1 Tax=Streptomyces macrolidinus TaxID=2952607 RepID=A0ABT0ZDV4_9ACTN|nr:small secreted protein [Streptomyces macrolidinus]MCN9241766.1 small secreted protein [Streptomyces macrolidinus]
MEGTNPVNKKLAAVLSGGAVLALALSGCSSSGGNDEKLTAWATKVCDATKPQVKKISEANAALEEGKSEARPPKEVQKTYAQAFQDLSDGHKGVGAAFEKAGAPDVDGGAAKQKKAVKELDDKAAAYADLKKQADELDTKDQTKFVVGLNGIAKQSKELSKIGDDAMNQLVEGDVGKAMSKVESCKKPGSASASPSAG